MTAKKAALAPGGSSIPGRYAGGNLYTQWKKRNGKTCLPPLGSYGDHLIDFHLKGNKENRKYDAGGGKKMRGLLQPMHIFVILVIVLIIFGPGKLPELGSSIRQSHKRL